MPTFAFLCTLTLALLSGCAATPTPVQGPTAAAPHVLHTWLGPDDPAEVSEETGPLLGPVMTAPGFDQLLPSWNADVPQDARLAVNVRVAAAGGPWSEWMTFGGWHLESHPTPLAAERVAWESEQGRVRVAIDVLESDFPLERYQLRISADGPTPVRVETLQAVASDTRWLSRRALGRERIQSVELSLAARSQRTEAPELIDRICSPTSVGMAMSYFRVDLPTTEVAQTLYDTQHDVYGNWNRAVQGAFELGVRGHLTRINDWNEVSDLLNGGNPLVISIRAAEGELAGSPYPETPGHLLVLRGLSPTTGRALVHDPAADTSATVARSYSLDDLETVWLRRSGVAYVFTGSR